MTGERKAFNIAENIFSVMCSLMKNLPTRMEYTRNNGMLCFNDEMMCQTYNMSIGFCGLDAAGRKLAEFCTSFGVEEMYVYAPDVNDLPANVKRVESLSELFERSKIISVHLPLCAGTEKYIKDEHFAKLRDGGMYINLYSSKLHDEDALKKELESGRIRAGLIGWHEKDAPSGKWNNLIMIGDSLR